ncbi:MAG: carbohydrate-binding protein [Sedimentisphaerales bacterium]|nr:carbohydrate-binding protein [Sedimentisphaerales bacterium]
MRQGSLSLMILVNACAGAIALGGESDPNQYDYTVPARAKLFSATRSGLAQAYQILNDGLNDPRVTGDERELVFLHALARAGMVVFDTSDAAVTTSMVEIVEPFGITVTGDEFFPKTRPAPDKIVVHFPVDPCDPNDCYEQPPGADPSAAVAAVNDVIIPEIDSIIAQLDTITDVPTRFTMTLTPAEMRLASPVEVDRGDVLAFKAALLAARAFLSGAANPAYDLAIDFADPLFEGLGCGDLPAGTTVKAVLDAYPLLLTILPETGDHRLGQARANLIDALDAALAAMDHMVAETDDQTDDLLHINEDSLAYATARTNLNELRDSLVGGDAGTYTVGSDETFAVTRGGAEVGRLDLRYAIPGYEGSGSLSFSQPDLAPAPVWEIESFEIDEDRIEGEAVTWEWWDWAWFEGTISSDGSRITDLGIAFLSWSDEEHDVITGLNARRTSFEASTVELDPNPLFAGSVSVRDVLPRFDASNAPLVGTFGHALGDDPTLGGITSGFTQEDWIGTKYAVFGVADSLLLPFDESFWHRIDRQPNVAVKLGESAGQTATFSGDYPWYIVATQSEILLDSVYGSGERYLDANDYMDVVNIPVFRDFWDWHWLWGDAILGPPDGSCAAVGDIGLLGQYTGFILIENPGAWTGLTVVTVKREPAYEAEAADLSGCVFGDDLPGYTGTGYVDFVHSTGAYIEWTVDVEASGPHRLEFRYALSDGDKPLEISINGQVGEPGLPFASTGDWASWGTVGTTMILLRGENTIRATTVGFGGAHIDHLRIVRLN